MRPHHLSYAFLISFICTTFFLKWWQLPQYPNELWILVGLLGFFGILGLMLHEGRRTGALIAAGTLGLAIAFTIVARTTHLPAPHTLDWYATGKNAAITGHIAREPDRRPLVTKYTIAAHAINDTPVTGLVLINDYAQFPEYEYGDTVTVQGKLKKPGPIEKFQYDKYLSRYGIYSVMYRGKIQVTENVSQGEKIFMGNVDSTRSPQAADVQKNAESRSEEEFFSREKQPTMATFIPLSPREKNSSSAAFYLFSTLYSLKSRFEYQINRIFPEPHASLLAGLLTGSRRGIPDHLLESFNATGLTHIIAISGYNITIIIAIITSCLFFLPLRKRLIPATLSIVLFTILVGAEASVIRAAIMGVLGLLALHTGRQKESRLLILWTIFLMLAVNPKYLWYDAGFQLSFLAVIGLVEISPLLAPYLKRVPHAFAIHESLQMTIAAQWFAIPWIAYLFGRISLISPIANILVTLPVPLAMLFGFVGVTVSFISFPPGQLISYAAWFFLEFVIQTATTLARVPFASIDIPYVTSASIIAYYLFLVAWLIWWKRRITTRIQIISFPDKPPSATVAWQGMQIPTK